MNATRLFISSIVATSFVGVIGLAYAQSSSGQGGGRTGPAEVQRTDPAVQPAPMDATMPANRGAMGTMNAPASGNTPRSAPGTTPDTMRSGARMSNDGTPMMTERAARADRN